MPFSIGLFAMVSLTFIIKYRKMFFRIVGTGLDTVVIGYISFHTYWVLTLRGIHRIMDSAARITRRNILDMASKK